MKAILSSEVWSLAWPIMLSNISIPLLGMVDTAVVGHLPRPDDIATVALGTMVFDILFWCFGFLRMSTTALAAQEPNSNQIYYQSSLIAIVIALLLIISSPLLKQGILLFIHTDMRVEQLLAGYFDIRIFSAIPTLINYVNYGFFFGRHNTKTPLILLLITNVTAMLLDYILVWHYDLGADGIALANLITQIIGASLGCGLIYKYYLKQSPAPKHRRLFSWQRTTQLFSLNTDIFIRTFFLVLTTSFFTRQSAYLGVEIVAANMILMNLQLLTSFALDGFAIAAETLVGRAVGKRDEQDFYHQVKACAQWSLIFGLMFMAGYYLFGSALISMMTSLATVRAIALHSLPWVILLPLISVPGFLLDGVFIGAAWSKPLRNAILFSSLIVFFPIWYFSQPLLNQGLWLSYTCFILARGIFLTFELRNKHKHLLKNFT
ncbi:MATE family efflux transporter [Legionella israelensis]|uniref:MATE family efflux transporter n=1 Tax=Legionella israelensis TaxID=454 RepID=A0AAX1EHZ2_9GAMM|nr:MATE family efflux transporter [Legionella israelensis]QBR84771.1 MATE family efflux transporter [Legionella israelensis]